MPSDALFPGPAIPTVLASRTDPAGDPAASLRAVLSSIGETLYDWDMTSDRITWGANAATTLRVPDLGQISTGRAYAYRVLQDTGVPRYDAVTRGRERDTGHGVPFQTTYALRSEEGEPLWIEDTGRWFAGSGGRPARVHGVVRVVAAPAQGRATGPFGDPLTGALSRGQLADILNDEITQARRKHTSFAMMLVGLENLSMFNESYGFDVSDELIAGTATRIRRVMRRGDALARYAGSKLAVVLMGCAEEQLGVAARRFIESVRETPLETAAGPIAAQVRIGGILLPRNGQTAAEAMQHAEEALADALASPTQSFVAFIPDRRREQRRQNNRRFTDEIVSALNERRVLVARQAVVHAQSRTVAFNEALVRIRRHDGSLMTAAQIVPMVEKLGFVGLLDLRVLELAVGALAAEPTSSMSLNVSSATLRLPEWMDALAAQLATRPDVARRLIVELTETSIIDDLEQTRRVIAAMKDLGARVAIDDFGAGHTSFRHLRDLGVDMVKIDGAFVQNLGRSSDDRFFVKTLLDLARHLEVEVVAEWVKDEETATLLRDWGVDYLQGELFGIAEPLMDPGAAAQAL
jgi:diguanylate cyclase (GGDEF)-like protein